MGVSVSSEIALALYERPAGESTTVVRSASKGRGRRRGNGSQPAVNASWLTPNVHARQPHLLESSSRCLLSQVGLTR